MPEPDDQARLRDLEARIAKARAAQQPVAPPAEGHALAEHGWRMVTELVAGLLIGFGIGWGLDTLFGTLPIFMVLFVLLGLAAGVKVMLRTAADLQKRQEGPAQAGEKRETDRG